MKEWLSKHKNEIIVGVAVSVLTTIVINLGGIFANVIPSTGILQRIPSPLVNH